MDKRFKHPLYKIASSYNDMRRKLPKQVSDIAVDEFKGNFKVGGYRGEIGTTFWKERSNNTWGKKTNNINRAILIKTGRLRRGIRPQPSLDTARVINDVPYANAHNLGFKGKITQRVKSYTRKTKKGNYTVKSHTRTIHMNLQARPFMITGSGLINNIDKHITKQIDLFLKQL